MRSFIYVLSFLATASAVVAAPQSAGKKLATGPKAIYFMTNDAAGNSIVAMKVNANGTLSDESITATGGKGTSGIDGKSYMPAGPDALFSQSALKVEGNMMVAVNAGSNTVTLMAIESSNPTKLTMIGQPVDTMDEFPVTAAISLKNKIACVGNTGARAAIACFAVDHEKGLTPLTESQIVFAIGQSTPPVGPENTVSQVFFNPDQSMLLTTVKGDPKKNNTGFLSRLPVQEGSVGTQDTRSSPPGTAVLFGTAPISGSDDIIATDASFGADTISMDGTPNVVRKFTIEGQKATCWAAISPLTKTAFVTDTGKIISWS